MAKQIRTLDINLLPKEHIVYTILHSDPEKIKEYINEVGKKYPAVQERIKQF